MNRPGPRGGVLIADDHPLFRDALRQVVRATLPDHVVHEASSFDEVMRVAGSNDLDFILLDINMPGMNGFNGLIALRNHVPAVAVVVVSADEAPDSIRQAMTLGASGFIPKSLGREQMEAAIRLVVAGEIFVPADGHEPDPSPHAPHAELTAQQRRVLELLVGGKSNKIIAFELGVTESTVKAHVSAILAKLKVSSRTQAVLNAGKLLASFRERSR
jgi:DNA-binding NarL/FixJ family response regulator